MSHLNVSALVNVSALGGKKNGAFLPYWPIIVAGAHGSILENSLYLATFVA
jgi:hypothetical protein